MDNINNLYLYIKFIKRNHLSNFIYKGEFHFESIKYYRERGKVDSTIGDIEEGTKNYNFSYGDTITIDKFKHTLLPREKVNIRFNLNDNAHIYCLSYITGKDLYKIRESVINGLQKNFPLNTYVPVLINKFPSLKNNLLSRFKASTFSNFITYSAKSKRNLAFKKVFTEFKHSISAEDYNNIQIQNTFHAFIKDKKYKKQREVRLLAINDSDLDKKIIYI